MCNEIRVKVGKIIAKKRSNRHKVLEWKFKKWKRKRWYNNFVFRRMALSIQLLYESSSFIRNAYNHRKNLYFKHWNCNITVKIPECLNNDNSKMMSSCKRYVTSSITLSVAVITKLRISETANTLHLHHRLRAIWSTTNKSKQLKPTTPFIPNFNSWFHLIK